MRCRNCDLEVRPGLMRCTNCGASVDWKTNAVQGRKKPVPVNKSAANITSHYQSTNKSIVRYNEVMDVSADRLLKNTISVFRYADSQVADSKDEEKLAETMALGIRDQLQVMNIEADVYVCKSLCNGYRHTLIKISNAEHGRLGIYFNKNVSVVFKIMDGKATLNERKYNSLTFDQAKQIRFDPTDVYFDQYWEKDILAIINSVISIS